MDSRFGLSRLIKKAPLVGAFLLSAFYLPVLLAECSVSPGLPLATVSRVVDGDTLRLADGRSVRLIGINTPEVASKGRPGEAYGVAARQRLEAMVAAAGRQVAIVPGAEPKDRYGRTLAHVYTADGRNLEAQLLQEGLGYQVVVLPNDALHQCHAAAEARARQSHAGVWKGFSPMPAAAIHRAGFAIVTGRVVKVTHNKGGVWLDVDGGLVLHVTLRDVPAFGLSALQALRNQRVEARGWVVDRGRRSGRASGRPRWALRLTAPAMLDVSASEAKVVGTEP